MTCNVSNKQRNVTEKVHLYINSRFWKRRVKRRNLKTVYRKWRFTSSENLYSTDGFIYTLASVKYGINITTKGDSVLIYRVRQKNEYAL